MSHSNQSLIAIDPGAKSACALLTVEANPRLVLHNRWNATNPLASQLCTPTDVIRYLVAASQAHRMVVGYAVIEDQYVAKNNFSAISLARNSGRWFEACAQNGLRATFIKPSSWQSAELAHIRGTGKRKSLKAATKAKAKALFGQDLCSDTADAAMLGRYAAIRFWRSRRAIRRSAM